MAATLEYDVSYFPFSKGVPDPSDVQAKLSAQASDGWQIAWVTTAGDGVLLILQRTPQPPPPPKASLGAYQGG